MRYLAVQFHLDKFNTPTLSCLYTRTTHYHGLTQWLSDKESACDAENTGDRGSIPGLGRSHGEGNGNPLKNFCLENPMDKRRLMGCSPKGHKELIKTEVT